MTRNYLHTPNVKLCPLYFLEIKDQSMKAISTFLILFTSIFFTIPIISTTICPASDSCRTDTGPDIRFPFRLTNRQPARCGYPGFDLYCNRHNQTILNLTNGEFTVNNIDYKKQTLLINDPDSCLPNRLMINVTLTGSPFMSNNLIDFTFLNCSYDRMEWDDALYRLSLRCRSGRNYTIMPKDSNQVLPAVCSRMTNVSVPMRPTFSMTTSYWTPLDLLDDLELSWREPVCGSCEIMGGYCGYLHDTGLELGCYWPSRRGLPRNAKLGILVGIGIPILVCLIVLVSYSIKVMRASIIRSFLHSGGVHATVTGQAAIRSPTGLDVYTIESYPKTLLGASRRLPDTSNITCSICLSDYQPGETLRTIPECNHYFHSDCIDDWLKINGTCPLCRNLPQPLTATMPFPTQIN